MANVLRWKSPVFPALARTHPLRTFEMNEKRSCNYFYFRHMFTLRWLQYRESFCMNYWILNVPLARTPSVAPARPVRSGQLECLPVNVFYAWPFRKWITLSLYQNSYYITPNIYSIGIAFLSTVAIFRPCPFNVQVFTTWRSTCTASAIVIR